MQILLYKGVMSIEKIFEKANSNIQELANIDKVTTIVYNEVIDNVDLEYILSGDDVKENIIVKGLQDKYEYVITESDG